MRLIYIFTVIFFLMSCSKVNKKEFLYDFSFEQLENKDCISIDKKNIYTDKSEFGYDLNTVQNSKDPFFFSVDLPEGSYLVHLTLGNGEKPTNTTVKSESRRLMLENIQTEKGEFVTQTITVNIRNTIIGGHDSVRIKPREIGKLIWDNKLTLEFNGINPSVTRLQIEKADDLPTIFLAGNSTVVDEANEPWCGWGQMFPRFFKPNIVVANYAESGEAANSFVSSKRLAKLLTKMKEGDFLFIEFGHNDQKQKGEGKGPFTSYKTNLKFLVDEAKKKGGFPILVTPMHRRRFDEKGKVINTHGEYPDAMRMLAEEEGVPLIDLNAMSADLYEAWGVDGSKKAFVHFPAGTFPNQEKDLADNTHFNPYGGYQIAKCILKGIQDNNLPLKAYIKDDFKFYDPKKPDSFDSFTVPNSPFTSLIKPDGN